MRLMTVSRTLKSALLGACFVMAAASGSAAKTLVFCSEGSPEGFDPALHTSKITFDASSKPLYNRLVEFKPGTTEVEPGLAESWDVSDDGLEITFYLRKGVTFHNTPFFSPSRALNADDVLFSLERQLKKSHSWHNYMPGTAWEFFDAMSMPEFIKDIVKVDDHTVKFVLTRPEAPILANLAMDFASILSAEYADQLEDAGAKEQLNVRPVGTGPFTFVGYQKDAIVRFSAHSNYWDGKQAIDNLTFAITPNAAVRLQKLKAGECHVMSHPAPTDIDGIRSDGDLTLMEQPSLNIGYLAYNTKVPPFDRKEVRRALSHAINKQEITEAVYQGAGQVAKNPFPPTVWSHNTAIEDDGYTPELAREMLAAAGIEDLSLTIWAMPVPRSYNPNARLMAEYIKADLEKVGVGVEIVSHKWGKYLSLSKDINRQGAVLFGWTGRNGDPDNFLNELLSCGRVGGSNRAQWCNDAFEALIKKARTTFDPAERARLYEEAQRVFSEEAPWVTIAHSMAYVPMSAKVTGYVMDPLGGHSFKGVDLTD
nr:ABC transporter substrate-binding protein [Roseibium alexandrii]